MEHQRVACGQLCGVGNNPVSVFHKMIDCCTPMLVADDTVAELAGRLRGVLIAVIPGSFALV